MKNKKEIIMVVAAVFTLMIFIVGATYAYFSETSGTESNTEFEVKTATTDLLTFSVGEQIYITADQTSFAQGMDSRDGETFAQASLTANNSTNEASANYYVYLDITDNTFKYTQKTVDGSNNTEYPELLLTIIDPSGTELTTLDGYTHKVVLDNKGTSISGFDVTETSGLVTLVNNKQIVAGTSSSAGVKTTNEKWQIKLTFVNYNENQTDNAGAYLNASVIIRKDEIKQTMETVCSDGQTLSSCIISMYGIDETLNHHDGTLTNGINDGSYRYAGADYKVTQKATDAGLNMLYSTQSALTNGLINHYCNDDKESALSYCSDNETSYYTLQYDTTTTQYSTIEEAIEKAISDGYYQGNMNNYVCISDETNCSDENLFRIIGLFDNEVKLIKATSIGSYAWDSAGTLTWSSASLNEYLNGDYLATLGSFAEKIKDTTWKVSGTSRIDITSSQMYSNEIVNGTLESGPSKIGLMYVSDYGLSADPVAWNGVIGGYSGYTNIDNSDATKREYIHLLNWLYTRPSSRYEYHFTISPCFNAYITAIESDGGLSYTSSNESKSIRPAFYLISSVTYNSGTGEYGNPIRLG